MATGSNPETSLSTPKQFPESPEISEISPSKRPKTLTLNSSPSPPSSSPNKGKSKIEEEDESEFDSCGICLSEEGKSIRGWIDSCNHYFCFVCIMEWAKVESRCPMCKRRFTTIRRSPKQGLFFSERIVNIPVRDQVYHHSGNATIGPPNPYSQVQCSVCSGGSDENLLLLCDLCDCAAHTYCVGLGATVPEGDWFCQDCTLSRDEHTKSEMDLNCDSRINFENFDKVQFAEASVSIFDVRESSIYEHERPSIAACSSQNQLASPIVPNGDILAENMTAQGLRRQPIVGHASTALEARTLQRCRNVQARIQVLRENWNAFRSGSLRFSSNLSNKSNAVVSGRLGQKRFSSSSSQQSTSQNNSSCNVLPNKGSYDVDRAWKMMDVAAKSIGRNHRRTSIVHRATKHPTRKVNSQKEAGKICSKLLTSNSTQFENKDYEICGMKKHQMFEKEKWRGSTLKDLQKNVEGSPTSSLGKQEFPSSGKVHMSAQVDKDHGSGGNLPKKGFVGDLSNVFTEKDESFSLIPALRSRLIASGSGISCARQELHASSSCSPEEKCRMKKVLDDSKIRKTDDAKSEIQSLVKLNLKLLSRDKKLEVNVFKEVARHATHSILAACGLELPKVGVRSFPKSVCSHVHEIQQRHRSTLMPTSCRECFFVFVKDVVNTIAFERTGCSKV